MDNDRSVADCEVCGNIFLNKTELDRHTEDHTSCNQCGKAFLSTKDLSNHARSHNQNLAVENLCLGFCEGFQHGQIDLLQLRKLCHTTHCNLYVIQCGDPVQFCSGKYLHKLHNQQQWDFMNLLEMAA